MKDTIDLHEKFLFIKDVLSNSCRLIINDTIKEEESKEYSAYQFKINSKKIVFRISKITPTKVGQFVSIWKRNIDGITEAYNISDGIDFYMIACFSEVKSGLFIFPSSVLIKEKIMSDNTFEGKRGIRVYPIWDEVVNVQAKKTKVWQEKYFVDLSLSNTYTSKQILEILSR